MTEATEATESNSDVCPEGKEVLEIPGIVNGL